jgi:hypothetical protein
LKAKRVGPTHFALLVLDKKTGFGFDFAYLKDRPKVLEMICEQNNSIGRTFLISKKIISMIRMINFDIANREKSL